MLTAITGINWGDEGKGRMVDLISQEYDIVARYQGGNNAGHTVKNERGKFVLNLLPSGILRPNVVCVMGNGMVIDPHHLDGEINKLRERHKNHPENLKISDRATITMPSRCRAQTSGGGSPVQDRRTVRLHQARHRLRLRRQVHEKDPAHGRSFHLDDCCEEASGRHGRSEENLVMEGSYNASPITSTMKWLRRVCRHLQGLYLRCWGRSGRCRCRRQEGPVGAAGACAMSTWHLPLRPPPPDTSSLLSPVRAACPGHKLHNSIGVMKAYSSCVGDGPFRPTGHDRGREARSA